MLKNWKLIDSDGKKSILFLKLVLVAVVLLFMASCGGNGGGSTTSADNGSISTPVDNSAESVSKLSFIVPNIIPSLSDKASYSYVVVMNTSSVPVSHISYTLTSQNGGGNGVTLDNNSVKSCDAIIANGKCVLRLRVESGSLAGSTKLSASNSGNFGNATLVSDSIGIEQSRYNSIVGPDGITLYYYKHIVGAARYILVTGVVSSNQVGAFNNVRFVVHNDKFQHLPDQQIVSGNLGAGLGSLSQGSTFAILLPAPSSGGQISGSQKILSKVGQQTKSITALSDVTLLFKTSIEQQSPDGVSSNIQFGTIVNAISTGTDDPVITPDKAIINTLNSVILTADNSAQTITISNTGNADATLNSLKSSSSNVLITGFDEGYLLIPGDSVTVTISLIDTMGSPTTSTVTLSYNDGIVDSNHTINVTQDLTLPPLPVKTPGLNLRFSSDGRFMTSTVGGAVSQQLIITNSGNTDETNMIISPLGEGFSFSTGATTGACTLLGNMVTTILQPGKECSITLVYSPSAVEVPQTNGNLSIASYEYDNGQQKSLTGAKIGYSYSVVLAKANLRFELNDYTLGPVLNDGISFVKMDVAVINFGDAAASDLSFSTDGANTANFSISGTSDDKPCAGVLAAHSRCNLQVIFGFVTNDVSVRILEQDLTLRYKPYSTSSSLYSEKIILHGAIDSAQFATPTISTAKAIGVAGGTGDLTTPYQVELGTAGVTLTYTINNLGSMTATNFYLTLSSLPNAWSVSDSSTCPTNQNQAISLQPHGDDSCTLVFTLGKSGIMGYGYNGLDLSWVTANWTDQANPNGTAQQFSGISYLNVYQPARIEVSTYELTKNRINQNDYFNVSVSLVGGYNVSAQSIKMDITPYSESITYYNNENQCQLSPTDTLCLFYLHLKDVNLGSYTIGITNTTQGGGITPKPNVIGFALPRLFSCVADGADSCACLIQNDGSQHPLMWYRSGSPDEYLPKDAGGFISNFNKGNGHCGYKDWRIGRAGTNVLETIDYAVEFGHGYLPGEFESLVSYLRNNEELNYGLNANGFNLDYDAYYVVSNTYVSDPLDFVWGVSFGYNDDYITPVELNFLWKPFYVLPVRGGQ